MQQQQQPCNPASCVFGTCVAAAVDANATTATVAVAGGGPGTTCACPTPNFQPDMYLFHQPQDCTLPSVTVPILAGVGAPVLAAAACAFAWRAANTRALARQLCLANVLLLASSALQFIPDAVNGGMMTASWVLNAGLVAGYVRIAEMTTRLTFEPLSALRLESKSSTAAWTRRLFWGNVATGVVFTIIALVAAGLSVDPLKRDAYNAATAAYLSLTAVYGVALVASGVWFANALLREMGQMALDAPSANAASGSSSPSPSPSRPSVVRVDNAGQSSKLAAFATRLRTYRLALLVFMTSVASSFVVVVVTFYAVGFFPFAWVVYFGARFGALIVSGGCWRLVASHSTRSPPSSSATSGDAAAAAAAQRAVVSPAP